MRPSGLATGRATGLATRGATALTAVLTRIRARIRARVSLRAANQTPLADQTTRDRAQGHRAPHMDATMAGLPDAIKMTAQADRARATEAKIPKRAMAPVLTLTGILAATASVATGDAAEGARNSAR